MLVKIALYPNFNDWLFIKTSRMHFKNRKVLIVVNGITIALKIIKHSDTNLDLCLNFQM